MSSKDGEVGATGPSGGTSATDAAGAGRDSQAQGAAGSQAATDGATDSGDASTHDAMVCGGRMSLDEFRAARARTHTFCTGEGVRGGAQPVCTVAVLFIIIDALPYEEVWRAWAAEEWHSGADAGAGAGAGAGSGARAGARTSWRARFWVHAKHPERVQSPWVRERLLPVSYRPEWGSVELVRAAVELMRTALADPSVVRLALASETCVPVASFPHVVREVTADPRSWIQVGLPRGRFDAAKFDSVKASMVPRDTICRADQWVLLTRRHALDVIHMPHALGLELWRAFNKTSTSDELYFPTLLAMAGAIKLDGERRAAAKARQADQQAETAGPSSAQLGRRARLRKLRREMAAKKRAAAAAKAGSGGAGSESASASGAGGSSGTGDTTPSLPPGSTTPCDEVSRRRCTFVHWGHYFDSHPRMFTEFDAALVQRARSSGCLFVRKVKVGHLSEVEWRRAMAFDASAAAAPALNAATGTLPTTPTAKQPHQPTTERPGKHPRDTAAEGGPEGVEGAHGSGSKRPRVAADGAS